MNAAIKLTIGLSGLIAGGALLLSATSAVAAVLTFSTYTNDVASASLGTTITGHGVAPGQNISDFTWNYSGNYNDARLSTYRYNNAGFDSYACIGLNGVCGTNNSDGVGGNDYNGYEYVYHTFNLPGGATNINLIFDVFDGDDRSALIVNGTLIGGYKYSATGASVINMLGGSGTQSVVFNQTPVPIQNDQSLFHAGENYFAIWINNTGSSNLNSAAGAHGSLFDPSGFVVRGGITYDTAAVPIPAALPFLVAGLGFIGLVGWRRKKQTV